MMVGVCWPALSICQARHARRWEVSYFASSGENPLTAAGCGRWADSGCASPLYGALSCVIPAETAADWITALLDLRELTHETASAVVQLGKRVDHRTRDIGRDVVRSAIAELTSAGVADDIL